MKKNKKTLILSALILVMVLSLTYIVTNIGAWLTDEKDTEKITIQVGKVEYELTGKEFTVDGLVVPEQNIVEGNQLKIKNKSNVDSQLRFKVEVKYGDDEMDDDLYEINFADDWKEEGDFYYLFGSSNEEEDNIIKAAIDDDGLTYDVLTSLVLNGEKVGNDYANEEFTIKFIFQAKQSDHLTWEEAGNLDFNTGLPN